MSRTLSKLLQAQARSSRICLVDLNYPRVCGVAGSMFSLLAFVAHPLGVVAALHEAKRTLRPGGLPPTHVSLTMCSRTIDNMPLPRGSLESLHPIVHHSDTTTVALPRPAAAQYPPHLQLEENGWMGEQNGPPSDAVSLMQSEPMDGTWSVRAPAQKF